MNITNQKGGPISLPVLSRLAGKASPIVFWANYIGIFAEFRGEWAHALAGSEWVTPETHSIFAIASANYDGFYWDRPYWEALPKDAIALGIAREALRVAKSAK